MALLELLVKSYQITLPAGRPFTIITEEPAANIAAAIKERFRVDPVLVMEL
jgi:hypothetical protein